MRFRTFYMDGTADGTLVPLGNGNLVSALGHVRFRCLDEGTAPGKIVVRHIDRIEAVDKEAKTVLAAERARRKIGGAK